MTLDLYRVYYFAPLAAYGWAAGALAVLLALARVTRGGRWTPLLAALLVGTMGYAAAELVFAFWPVRPGPYEYFLNRSYQYIPLLLLLAFFPRGETLGVGNLRASAQAGVGAGSWGAVVARFAATVGAVGLVMAWMRPLSPPGAAAWGPILLGAANNCFIEEALFRGVLLSVGARSLGPDIANGIQAGIFGLLHFPSLAPWHYLAQAVIFSFLGWFFGRSALQTRGLLASFLMHLILVLALWAAAGGG